jgi:hypothetical protein
VRFSSLDYPRRSQRDNIPGAIRRSTPGLKRRVTTLLPGEQKARYLWQDLAVRANFKGSLVLRGQSGASFVAVALLQKQGLYTVIPLIPGKAPGIPD